MANRNMEFKKSAAELRDLVGSRVKIVENKKVIYGTAECLVNGNFVVMTDSGYRTSFRVESVSRMEVRVRRLPSEDDALKAFAA